MPNAGCEKSAILEYQSVHYVVEQMAFMRDDTAGGDHLLEE
jgi:hypothetical protein